MSVRYKVCDIKRHNVRFYLPGRMSNVYTADLVVLLQESGMRKVAWGNVG